MPWQTQAPAPLRTLAPAATDPSVRWRTWAFVALVATLILLLGLVIRREFGSPPPVVIVPPATMAVRPATDAPRPATAPPSVVTPQASVVLVTEPAGAEVVEESRVLGTTPLTMTIDPPTLGRLPRLLVLRKDGYQSQSVELGPVAAGTVIQRTLVRGGRKPR
jgi:hypothetical protein